jgi:ABC-type sugar transport system ATPase subunit
MFSLLACGEPHHIGDFLSVTDYLLECRGISYQLGAKTVLEDIDLTLSPAERIVLFSHSQEAASSLLQICSTLVRPTKGELFIEGTQVNFDDHKALLTLKRKLAYVDRRSTLIQNLSVLENIALAGIYHENRPLEEISIQLEPIIEMLSLREVLNLRPAEIDHATKSRALYAVEMAKEPVLALFDQPENDYHTNDRQYLYAILSTLREESHCGFIVATKSKSLIKEWGDVVAAMKDGSITAVVDKDSFLSS